MIIPLILEGRDRFDELRRFRFGRCDGLPKKSRHTIEVKQRGGTDGTAQLARGVKGDPFTLTTQVDYPTMAAAQLALVDYGNFIKAAPVKMYQHGTFWGDVFVNDVQEGQNDNGEGYFAVHGLVGGLNTPKGDPAIMLVAEWQLTVK